MGEHSKNVLPRPPKNGSSPIHCVTWFDCIHRRGLRVIYNSDCTCTGGMSTSPCFPQSILCTDTRIPNYFDLLLSDAFLPWTLPFFKAGLQCWGDIDKLNSFPKLEEVRLLGIPLLQPYTNEERRKLVIARSADVFFCSSWLILG